ncbi:hypothetical protein NDU88_000403 [Pleurodeles waltl]|uniref:Uncharacterized protein n=1 Tax=Pleurodeles waltl TaxID=8319 RepID=A0AAV7L895_PLEWA|nr:hypothetical protein NDU88_000403 [Pleurodeles waltl]
MYLTIPIPNGTIPTLSSEILTNFPNRNTERKGIRPNPTAEKNNLRWSRRPCAMEPKREESFGPVTKKDFFEEKQLVILRAQHQAADCGQRTVLNMCICSNICHRTVGFILLVYGFHPTLFLEIFFLL